MKPTRVHPQAESEAESAYEWYSVRSGRAGLHFHAELTSILRALPAKASISLPYLHGTRRIFLTHFPYAVIYRDLLHEFQIIAVAHARRRPGYWSSRL